MLRTSVTLLIGRMNVRLTRRLCFVGWDYLPIGSVDMERILRVCVPVVLVGGDVDCGGELLG